MSTDRPTRRARAQRRRGRAFALSFALVLGILAAVGLAGAAASVAQGPRVTDVSVDPAAAAAASGSRLIVTTTQSLADVDPSQVTVSPETPFQVDTSGRSVGVRFTLPLWDDTDYTVTIAGVTSLGGGPTATVTETFRTPKAEVYLLQRGRDDGDLIYRTDLSGQKAVPVFRHDHIEDFRATGSHLVVSVRTDDDQAGLIVTDLDGENPHELPLPGDGFVSNLQSADRGERIGYTFSDAQLSADSGRESRLYTASLGDPDAAPVAIEVQGADPRVAEWRFVPDTDSILLLSFDGSLLLTGSDASGATTARDSTALGVALGIDGIARGSNEAVVDRPDQESVIDLTDASEVQLVAPDQDLGGATSVTPLPDGSTIRTAAELDADDVPTGRTTIALVAADGTTRMLSEVDDTDAVLQVCVSPSSRYVAVLVAPDAVTNAYDTYQLPLPQRPETRVLEISDGAQVVALNGAAISWCQVPPAA
ncbi:hypothetical protein [Microbacterium jejuense]|uniref:hypothetical protein n=1 Tax=Microbacterium jejuense TaxID=1263637 RepID=UPI0031E8A978